ncbi:FixH family protein [Membranihabitans marinus]|uniref:FixH family protein n=1 Tax=Membranihabitans marinus TaxID=1227546 RepID=UPI001F31B73C|nr:FixH family protein [Membranihabitans marinus]
MLKLNWGQSLLIFFICYVSTLGYVLYRSTQVDHSLVMKDYYKHDLAYQNRYDQIENRKKLDRDLQINYEAETAVLTLDFGPNNTPIQGEVVLYSPSDELKDKKWKVSVPNGGKKQINFKDLASGKYHVQVEWQDGTNSYYKETNVVLP